jgi:hypothetical protein
MQVGLPLSLTVLQIVVSNGVEGGPSVVRLLRLWGELTLELLLLLGLLPVAKIT